MPAEPRYDFRAVTSKDLPMLARWLKEPHLAEWWGDPAVSLSEIEDAMEDIATEPLTACTCRDE